VAVCIFHFSEAVGLTLQSAGKRTEDGFLIYTEEELGLNKEGGGGTYAGCCLPSELTNLGSRHRTLSI